MLILKYVKCCQVEQNWTALLILLLRPSDLFKLAWIHQYWLEYLTIGKVHTIFDEQECILEGMGRKKIKKGKNIAVGAPYHSRYDIVKRISTYWLRWKLNMLNSYFSLQDVSIWQKKRWTITGKSFPCLRRLLLRIFHITDSVLQFIELPNNSESASNWISK